MLFKKEMKIYTSSLDDLHFQELRLFSLIKLQLQPHNGELFNSSLINSHCITYEYT